MNSDALSPRHRESPLTRRSRDIPPPTTNCLEVQWRFLQHKNPKPPQFGSPQRKTLLVEPISPIHTPRKHLDPAPTRDSPSRLIHMFERQDADAEESTSASVTQSYAQPSHIPGSPCASRTLNVLMGETQRQAMLDRILADMEDLAVEPTYPRLGQPDNDKNSKASSRRDPQRARAHKPSILEAALKNEPNSPYSRIHAKQRKFSVLWSRSSQDGYSDDADDDDDEEEEGDGALEDRKRRQRRKVQQFNQEDDDPRIFWQQTTGARSAADVPERLLTLSPPPPRRMRSAHIVLGRRSYTTRQLLASSSVSDDRQRSRTNVAAASDLQAAASSTTTATPKLSPRRRRRHNVRVPAAASSANCSSNAAPASPSKTHYGAWYVPQSQWWNLHQLEQQTAPATANTADEPHCHGACTSPMQRQHKPPLPSAALSPRPNESDSAKPALQTSRANSRIPSASAAPPSASGPLELQVAGIPQSYIGREYRAYIVSTGTTLPQYLQ
ncbi:hypothetical protein PR003_g20616 [Phytophthora rubi]|uniref:Uncharacterized protein n=1 Tax=Phytophthora rubi TaxID=129364 RepID=A0A6A3JGG4_9STRA|nr:hypothetical protein PR002_g20004 [Phytophthora rubi]KAE8997202.1 hypothetical protein PR001_g19647 [Phytophthora rubi]KAE9308983.1 hypothetical protein PR003_g20616 [Phytophthora rubi]